MKAIIANDGPTKRTIDLEGRRFVLPPGDALHLYDSDAEAALACRAELERLGFRVIRPGEVRGVRVRNETANVIHGYRPGHDRQVYDAAGIERLRKIGRDLMRAGMRLEVLKWQ